MYVSLTGKYLIALTNIVESLFIYFSPIICVIMAAKNGKSNSVAFLEVLFNLSLAPQKIYAYQNIDLSPLHSKSYFIYLFIYFNQPHILR